jgi:alpha-L-arabinofuranosidase
MDRRGFLSSLTSTAAVAAVGLRGTPASERFWDLRNRDVVQMASYAPLLAHVDAWQWTRDAIWFDNLRSYGTPNYYVQMLYAKNVGTKIVPVSPQAESGLYTRSSFDARTNELIMKVINSTASARPADIKLNGVEASGKVKTITLQSPDPAAENGFDNPIAVAPTQSTIEMKSGTISAQLNPYSVNVFRVPMH